MMQYEEAIYCHSCGELFHMSCLRTHFQLGCYVDMEDDGSDNNQIQLETIRLDRHDQPIAQCLECSKMLPIHYTRPCPRCWGLLHPLCWEHHEDQGCKGSIMRLWADTIKNSRWGLWAMMCVVLGSLQLTLKAIWWGLKCMGATWKNYLFMLLLFSAFTLCKGCLLYTSPSPRD